MPGGFIPIEDQGYFIVNAQLPNGASLERTQEVMDEINEQMLDAARRARGGHRRRLLDAQRDPGAQLRRSPSSRSAVGGAPRPGEQHVGPPATAQASSPTIDEAIVFGFPPPAVQGLGDGRRLPDGAPGPRRHRPRQPRDLRPGPGGGGKPEPDAHPHEPELRGQRPPALRRRGPRQGQVAWASPCSAVFNTLQANLGSAYVNDFNLFGRTWRVMVQADQQFRSRVSDINRLEVRSAAGDMVPLGTLVQVTRHRRPPDREPLQHLPFRRRSPASRRPG